MRRECRSVSAEPVCSCACFCARFAHETAGAARTRYSLRPLIGGSRKFLTNLGHIRPRECEVVSAVIARSESDDRVRRSSTSEGGSNPSIQFAAPWIASPALAMTVSKSLAPWLFEIQIDTTPPLSSSATRLRQGFAGVAVLGRRSFSEGGRRMTQYSRAPAIEPRGLGVLDTPLSRGMTVRERYK